MTPDSYDSIYAAKPFVSSMGSSTHDHIDVQGYDLAGELMGKVDFGSMFFVLLAGRLPSDAEAALFNAVLVALADHGMTPSVLAARLTYTGAPEAVQGAVAAGVLGAGSTFLGVFEDSARFLVGLNAPTDATTPSSTPPPEQRPNATADMTGGSRVLVIRCTNPATHERRPCIASPTNTTRWGCTSGWHSM